MNSEDIKNISDILLTSKDEWLHDIGIRIDCCCSQAKKLVDCGYGNISNVVGEILGEIANSKDDVQSVINNIAERYNIALSAARAVKQ